MKFKHPNQNVFWIFPIISIFFLSGCINLGGSSANKTDDARIKTYDGGAYSVKMPAEWEIIEKKDFTSDVPDVTMVVFRNNVKNETFTANVNIVLNPLQQTTPTVEYAKMVINRQKGGLIDFKEIKREDTKIQIGGKGADSLFLVFDARKNADNPLIRYFQTYAVKDKQAYIISGALSPGEDNVMMQTVESIVKSLQLK
jgi:hypothetical protein